MVLPSAGGDSASDFGVVFRLRAGVDIGLFRY
jgi:hypothetical protein